MRYEQTELKRNTCGSWMPLDQQAHWQWYNPLNLLIVLPVVLLVLSLLATF